MPDTKKTEPEKLSSSDISARIREIESEKKLLLRELLERSKGYVDFFTVKRGDPEIPSYDEIKAWLEFCKVDNSRGVFECASFAKVNIQNAMIYLKYLYQARTSKEYSVLNSLTFSDLTGYPRITYSLVPSYDLDPYLNNVRGEDTYRQENFLDATSKVLRIEHWADDLIPGSMAHAKGTTNRKSSSDHKQGRASDRYLFIPTVSKEGKHSIARYPLDVTIYNSNMDVNKFKSIIDLFNIQTNHGDNQFITDGLFRLLRENMLHESQMTCTDYENLIRHEFGVPCNLKNEVNFTFNGFSYLRNKK